MSKTHNTRSVLALAIISAGLVACGAGEEKPSSGISPQTMSDALHAVMEADRTVYTKLIINRLQNDEKVIKASEHWEDEKALVLPAQMFRYGAERVAEKGAPFSYSLLSLWPVNKQNNAKTEIEKTGLQYIADNPGKNYYGQEELGGVKYFTAVYPDVAVAPACINCHNDHKDSPRSDFKIGDIMGGVVLRIPLS